MCCVSNPMLAVRRFVFHFHTHLIALVLREPHIHTLLLRRRVDAFRAYYQSVEGNVVLVLVVVIFGLLVGLLGVIVRVRSWTRWDLRRLAEEQERLGAQ